MTASPADVTRLLLDHRAGDPEALARLLPMVYPELRALAQRHLWREGPPCTLATTDLVHEAFLKLVDQDRVQWQDRAHFFAIAATVMRRVLIDRARARRAVKRGSGRPHTSLDAALELSEARAEELIVLDEALERLAAREPRHARVVECRYFAGLTIEETAAALGVGPTTVKADWALARAWLYRELRRELG